ncbi:MAG: hypothetical protein IJV27_04790 [Prevotella sp.]|nr:hypothetical protein [Prevotella sp.]
MEGNNGRTERGEKGQMGEKNERMEGNNGKIERGERANGRAGDGCSGGKEGQKRLRRRSTWRTMRRRSGLIDKIPDLLLP